MKIKSTLTSIALTFLTLSTVHAQGTAFTYQGRLNDGASPASGTYNLTFSLFNTNTSGVAIDGPVTNNAVNVTNGLFTVLVNFGSGAFTGQSNWLEIAVETNLSSSFITLTPRQPLTPTPYAIYAENANAAGISGTVPNGSLSGTYGNVVTMNNAGNSFTGSGAGLTGVNAVALNGLNATNFWQTGGNNVAPGQFFGSTNNQAVEIRVSSQRALLLTANASDSPNIIGGSPANVIDAGVTGAVIAGGGATNSLGGSSTNRVSADYSSIGGGSGNWIQSGADHSVIGNGLNNLIASNAFRSVIVGGQNNVISNDTTWAFIGGGSGNVAAGDYAGAMGYNTTANGPYSTAMGLGTIASGSGSTAMGDSSTASGSVSTAMGIFTTASGTDSTAMGSGTAASGIFSTAMGDASAATTAWTLAAGRQAKAIHVGAFVWADSTFADFASTANNQFLIRASGGVGINMNNPNGASLYVQGNRTPPSGNSGWAGSVGWFENTSTATNAAPALRVVCDGGTNLDGALSVSSNGKGLIAEFGNAASFVVTITNDGTIYSKGVALTSDRNAKENFTVLDAEAVLSKVTSLPVTEWNYRDDGADKKHIGPVAQDFQAAFGLNGGDDTHISVVDEGGVALAAIQGLNQKLNEQDTEIQELKEKAGRVAALEKRLNELEQMVQSLVANK